MAGVSNSEIETDLKRILKLDEVQERVDEKGQDFKRQKQRSKNKKSNKKHWRNNSRKKSQAEESSKFRESEQPVDNTRNTTMNNNNNIQETVQTSILPNPSTKKHINSAHNSSPSSTPRELSSASQQQARKQQHSLSPTPISAAHIPPQMIPYTAHQEPVFSVSPKQQHLRQTFDSSYQINQNVPSHCFVQAQPVHHQRPIAINQSNPRQLHNFNNKKYVADHQSARSHNPPRTPSHPFNQGKDQYNMQPQRFADNHNMLLGNKPDLRIVRDNSESRRVGFRSSERKKDKEIIRDTPESHPIDQKSQQKGNRFKEKKEKNEKTERSEKTEKLKSANSKEKTDPVKKTVLNPSPRTRQKSENEKEKEKKEENSIPKEKEKPKESNKGSHILSKEEQKEFEEKNREDIAKLRKEFIYPLSKIKAKFPWARFFCQLCDLHQSDLEDANKHGQSKKHIINLLLKKDKQIVLKIRNPSKSHNDLLTEMIETVVEENGLTEDDFDNRWKVAIELEQLLREVHPKVKLHIVGSTATGAGIKSSDLNLDIEFDDPEILLDVYQLLQNNDCYTDIKFNKKCRVASVHAVKDGLPLTITVAQSNTRDMTKLLKTFMIIDQRARKLCIAFRKLVDVIDGGCLEMGMMPTFIYYIMVVFFLQQSPYPVLPVLHRKFNRSDDVEIIWDPALAVRIGLNEKKLNNLSLGELWFDLIMFYAIEFNARRFVVSIRQLHDVRKYDRRWFRKVYSVEDPMNPKMNMIKSLSATGFNYLQTAWYKAALYYGKKLNKFSNEEPLIRPWDIGTGRKLWENTDDEISDNETISKDEIDTTNATGKSRESPEEIQKLGRQSRKETKDNCQKEVSEKDTLREADTKATEIDDKNENLNDKVKEEEEVEDEENFKFTIDAKIFNLVKPAPSVCTLCDEEGHSKINCPNEELPELEELPAYNKSWDKTLTDVLRKIPELCELKEKDFIARETVMQTLANRISTEFKDVWLSLFGSSNNGFGFKDSDIDVCMTLRRSPVLPKNIHSEYVIKRVSKVLKHCGEFREIMDIPSAKVPIVKFTHKDTGLDGDISLYNTLALRNTRLLYTYSQIDERCRILGYTSKIFARRCDIGDASRGSLSSYAYILMVIYFLQQTEPPVLPVLQELYDGSEPPKYYVEGCNTYFFDNIKDIIEGRVWNCNRNTKSAGELWLDMLKFYTEKFDFSNTVISIRQKKSLSTLKKLWTGCAMAIEDPFDLNHNLGGFLTGRMRNFILQAFRRARVVFGTPLDHIPDDFESYEEYLFSRQALYPGKERPKDRLCRKCGHVGHTSRDCKRKRQNSRGEKPIDDDDTWWRRSFSEVEEVKKDKRNADENGKNDKEKLEKTI
ncbi:DgyrCDS921 [Dimorphilus gyrociliatus]|uniref:DgyrCDS921 n=1 Tax=Dimorphilus gyrociliatus TaxID=2664684 RepID=A0A7I8V7T3_9ANNE|nr:DgyrCDS921 [Dimorphilus gyrociliatus]